MLGAVLLMGASLRVARADDPTMTAHVAGRAWASTRAFVIKTVMGGRPAININGFLEGSDSKSHFGFLVSLPSDGSYVHDFELGSPPYKELLAGTAKVSTGNIDLDFGGANIFANKYDFVSGHLVITGFDPKADTFVGTFAGTVKNAEGKSLDVTDGHLQNIVVNN